MVSVERDPERARIAADLFRDRPHVEVRHGDWQRVEEGGPYDLLVLDGGGQAKGDGTADPARLLIPGGTLVIDDFTPVTTWPPRFNGEPDRAPDGGRPRPHRPPRHPSPLLERLVASWPPHTPQADDIREALEADVEAEAGADGA